MSQVTELNRPSDRKRRQRELERSSPRAGLRATLPVFAAVAALEVLFVVGLVVAVPIGRGATVIAFALAFLLAVCIGRVLGAGGDHRRGHQITAPAPRFRNAGEVGPCTHAQPKTGLETRRA